MREQEVLLVLDNFETLFEPGQTVEVYRSGLAGYGRLLRAIGEASHQSCLVLTSREMDRVEEQELANREEGRRPLKAARRAAAKCRWKSR